MTAKEFLKNIKHKGNINNVPYYSPITIRKVMIEFAKYHVEQALKEASEKATAGQEFIDMGGEFEDIPIYEAYVIKDSILKVYPLENIK